jgi:hypothetical protein
VLDQFHLELTQVEAVRCPFGAETAKTNKNYKQKLKNKNKINYCKQL